MILFDETKIEKKAADNQAIFDESNLRSEKEIKKKRPKIKSSIADIIPVIDITAYDFFELRNGEFMEIVQLSSKDIYSLNENDKDSDIFSWAYFYQAYLHPIKILPLNTPVNLELQKNNVLRRIKKNKVPAYLPFLEKKLAELEFLEEHRTNREYFLFIYAEDEKTLLERKSQIRKLLARCNPIIEISAEKKINVLYQLSNPNSKPKMD